MWPMRANYSGDGTSTIILEQPLLVFTAYQARSFNRNNWSRAGNRIQTSLGIVIDQIGRLGGVYPPSLLKKNIGHVFQKTNTNRTSISCHRYALKANRCRLYRAKKPTCTGPRSRHREKPPYRNSKKVILIMVFVSIAYWHPTVDRYNNPKEDLLCKIC